MFDVMTDFTIWFAWASQYGKKSQSSYFCPLAILTGLIFPAARDLGEEHLLDQHARLHACHDQPRHLHHPQRKVQTRICQDGLFWENC